jgi:hypothetical protein
VRLLSAGPAVRIKRSEIDAAKRHGDLSSGHDSRNGAAAHPAIHRGGDGGKPSSNKDGGDWMAFMGLAAGNVCK